MKRKYRLSHMFKEGRFLRIVGAHDGLSAKLVEEAGFDGVWASGFAISTSHAVPDANILTMKDFLEAAQQMANAVTIPIIADCDTGFGNSNNVMHLVRKFEAAGIAAVCIEDKKFPKVNSFVAGRQELAAMSEFVGKIMAAKNSQVSKQFMVFARTEALIAGWGHEEALRRAHAYIDAGADGIFIHSKSSQCDEIIDFCRAWKKRSPLIICPTTYCINEDRMREFGVNVIIYANQGIRASIKYMQEILAYLKKNGTSGIDTKIAPMDEVFRLQGMHAMKHSEKKFLKPEIGSIQAIIPAAGQEADSTLGALLTDRPVGMLDVNGKTLLERNVETLNMAGIQDITVVTGYQAEAVFVEGANIVKNRQFNIKGIMHSVIKGISAIADKNIILYSDLIVDRHLVQRLVRKEGDIVIVVDSTYKKTHARSKKLELVKVKGAVIDKLRTIDTNRRNPVIKIGKNLSEKDAHFEFIGMALFSRRGMQILIKEFKAARLPQTVSFADFLQYLITKGVEVLAYEVTGGWMEVHNFNDYKRAVSVFS